MNDATLQSFRDLADAMQGDAPRDWQWIGVQMSQRMFGITQARAQDYAVRFGGRAQQMQRDSDNYCRTCGQSGHTDALHGR